MCPYIKQAIMAAKCKSPAVTVPGHSLCADLAQACSQGHALPCRSHLGGVSRHSPFAPQAEVREGERAADSVADSFHFGWTRILLVWAEGPKRGQEASPPARQPSGRLSRVDGRGCTSRGDSGRELEKVTGVCLTTLT